MNIYIIKYLYIYIYFYYIWRTAFQYWLILCISLFIPELIPKDKILQPEVKLQCFLWFFVRPKNDTRLSHPLSRAGMLEDWLAISGVEERLAQTVVKNFCVTYFQVTSFQAAPMLIFVALTINNDVPGVVRILKGCCTHLWESDGKVHLVWTSDSSSWHQDIDAKHITS